jgi:two-component system sensor histidine kinase KdpD
VSLRRDLGALAATVIALGSLIATYLTWLHITNPLIIGFTFLLVVLPAAATARLWVPATVSVLAMLAFNFFFLAPVGTFYLADPQNWVALVVFLTVSLVASNLSTTARARAREAVHRQDELVRLFEVSRDVLQTTGGSGAITELVDCITRRFGFEFAAICLPSPGQWDIYAAGSLQASGRTQLVSVLGNAEPLVEREAEPRTGVHRMIEIDGQPVRLVPLRLGLTPVGVLAAAGRSIEASMFDALAGVAAIAIERAQFLDERNAAELARRSEELKSALLASIGHDLRTPLTAIRIAASNLQASWLADSDRREQTDVILAEVERLHRLFQNILEMARIETGAVAPEARWVHPSEIVDAARDQVQPTLRRHHLDVQIESDVMVRVDPRLTASALARVLENAAQYSPAESRIAIHARVSSDGLTLTVRDHGPGIAFTDLPHVFDRFYRGKESKRQVSGTGMGLSVARGLLAAEHGRIVVENCADGGARFTFVVPAERRVAAPLASEP